MAHHGVHTLHEVSNDVLVEQQAVKPLNNNDEYYLLETPNFGNLKVRGYVMVVCRHNSEVVCTCASGRSGNYM